MTNQYQPFCTVLDFKKRKESGGKISMVTCYDACFAKLIANSPVDTVLVGDSLAMTVYGRENTLGATLDEMERHVEAVARELKGKFVVGDLPFLSYRGSLDRAVDAVQRLLVAGAQAVKLEGGFENLELIKHLSESGVPVLGHLGLTPQHINQLGGFRVQAKGADDQKLLLEAALALEEAGIVALVLECVPSHVGSLVSNALKIPVIGIGAGLEVDGQVLVLNDLLGLNAELSPKFVKRYLNGEELVRGALLTFDSEVKEALFPAKEHSYA
jgi:3-methyl-2-oxobutanoate hydroxymethyltransferase